MVNRLTIVIRAVIASVFLLGHSSVMHGRNLNEEEVKQVQHLLQKLVETGRIDKDDARSPAWLLEYVMKILLRKAPWRPLNPAWTELRKPEEGVTDFKFHKDGKKFVYIKHDGTIRTCVTATGELESTESIPLLVEHFPYEKYPDSNIKFHFSHDLSKIAILGLDENGTYAQQIYNRENGNYLFPHPVHNLFYLAFSPDNLKILFSRITPLAEHFVIYDISSNNWEELPFIWDHQNKRIYSAHFDNKGQNFIANYTDGTLEIWDYRAKAIVKTMNFPDSIHDIVFNTTGERILISTHTRAIQAYQWLSDEHLFEIKADKPEVVLFSPKDRLILTLGSWGEGVGKLWDGSNGEYISSLSGNILMEPKPVFSDDGSRLLGNTHDGPQSWVNGATQMQYKLQGMEHPPSTMAEYLQMALEIYSEVGAKVEAPRLQR